MKYLQKSHPSNPVVEYVNLKHGLISDRTEPWLLMDMICNEAKISESDLTSANRKRELADVRKIFCMITKEYFGEKITYQEMGWMLGKDHSTAMSAEKEGYKLIKGKEQKIY